MANMLEHTVFSLAGASSIQVVAFITFGLFTIGFFVWVAYLAQK
jgi:hypothetical protein